MEICQKKEKSFAFRIAEYRPLLGNGKWGLGKWGLGKWGLSLLNSFREMGSVTIKFKMAGYLSLREQYAFCMF